MDEDCVTSLRSVRRASLEITGSRYEGLAIKDTASKNNRLTCVGLRIHRNFQIA
jgi:hypothetical protein